MRPSSAISSPGAVMIASTTITSISVIPRWPLRSRSRVGRGVPGFATMLNGATRMPVRRSRQLSRLTQRNAGRSDIPSRRRSIGAPHRHFDNDSTHRHHGGRMDDCQRCGACCCNPSDNRAEGFDDWIEVESGAPLLRRRRLASLVARGANGRPHLRVDGQGRCVALRGQLGQRVRCTIYPVRPRACRRVMPGDPDCLQSRLDRGLGAERV